MSSYVILGACTQFSFIQNYSWFEMLDLWRCVVGSLHQIVLLIHGRVNEQIAAKLLLHLWGSKVHRTCGADSKLDCFAEVCCYRLAIENSPPVLFGPLCVCLVENLTALIQSAISFPGFCWSLNLRRRSGSCSWDKQENPNSVRKACKHSLQSWY